MRFTAEQDLLQQSVCTQSHKEELFRSKYVILPVLHSVNVYPWIIFLCAFKKHK
jgi:hypothetical protein